MFKERRKNDQNAKRMKNKRNYLEWKRNHKTKHIDAIYKTKENSVFENGLSKQAGNK